MPRRPGTAAASPPARPRPVEGGERVAHHFAALTRKRPPEVATLERMVNGRPGLVVRLDGVTVSVMAFDIAHGRIKRIWTVLNPEKLRPWTTDGEPGPR